MHEARRAADKAGWCDGMKFSIVCSPLRLRARVFEPIAAAFYLGFLVFRVPTR